MSGNKLYVGHLEPSCTEENIREAFEKIGAVTHIEMKNNFCFVTYEDAATAEKALRDLNNASIPGSTSLNVQVAKGPRPEEPRKMQDRYRILIENVVPEASWMDLKDFARDRGVIANYADVRIADGKATGVLAFPTIEDTEEALRKLDGQSMLGNTLSVSKDENYVPRESRPRPDRSGSGRSADRLDDRRRDYDRRDYDRRDYDRRDFDRRDDGRRDFDRRDYDRRDFDRRDYDRRPPVDYDRRPSMDYDRRPPMDYDRYDRRDPPRDYDRGRDAFRGPPPRGGDYYPDRDRDRERYPGPPGGYDRGGRFDRSPPRRSPPRAQGGGVGVCYAFQRGECNRGDACKYMHIRSSER